MDLHDRRDYSVSTHGSAKDARIAELEARIAELETWIENVATDSQLDEPVPCMGGKTGRAVLAKA